MAPPTQRRGGSYLALLTDMLSSSGVPSAGPKGGVDVSGAVGPRAEAHAPAQPAAADASVSVVVAATPRRHRSSPTPPRRPASLLSHLHPASPFWELAPHPAHHPLAAMPPRLRFNPFIAHGFRPAGAHPWACVCSWASLHNESVNVWSHLAPLLAGLSALACGLARPWPAAPAAWVLSALPAALCLAGSVTYHTLMPAHDRYALWLALDLSGVFLLFVAGMAPLLWWGFACHPGLRACFLSLYYGGAGAAVLASLRAKTPASRAAPMAALAGVRFTTLAARAFLKAGAPAALPHYVAMEALSIGGALINVARWPEKWLHGPRAERAAAKAASAAANGKGGQGEQGTADPVTIPPHVIDFAFNSHNLMHGAVLLALVAYGRGAGAEYEHYHVGGGAACGGGGA